MNLDEYYSVKDLSYLEYCDYLQDKYGIGKCNFMFPSFNKNHKVTRTEEGLIAHHKMEYKALLLSKKSIAQQHPYEYQLKENIVYCDYLEHFLLHIKIVAEYKLPPMGIVSYLIPELNDVYSGWQTRQEWRKNCHAKIIDDFNTYLELIYEFYKLIPPERYNKKIFITSLNRNYGGWTISNDKETFITIFKRIKAGENWEPLQ